MRVFLTGGTGLVGSHVAERLRAKGMGVRVLHRRGSDLRFLQGLGCETVAGEILDSPEEQARRMEGCQALVHAAADVYGVKTLDEARAVNVEGTRRVFLGAVSAGVARGVHISSVAVYGDAGGRVTEEMANRPEARAGNVYALSKWEAEEVVIDLHQEGGVKVTVLRPPAIFGERDRRLVPGIIKILKRRLVPLPGSGANRLALVYAGNLAQAVERGLEGFGEGEAFNVTEDSAVTVRSFLGGLARELELPVYFLPIPAYLMRTVARLGDQLGLGVPGAGGLTLSRAARKALEDNPFPADRARGVLGWDPPFTLDEALARTGQWFKEEGRTE